MNDIILLRPSISFNRGISNTYYGDYSITAWIPIWPGHKDNTIFYKLISEFEGTVMSIKDDRIQDKDFLKLVISFPERMAAEYFYQSYLLEIK